MSFQLNKSFPKIVVFCGKRGSGKTHAFNCLNGQWRLVDKLFDSVLYVQWTAIINHFLPSEYQQRKLCCITNTNDFLMQSKEDLEKVWDKIKESKWTLVLECCECFTDIPPCIRDRIGLVLMFKQNHKEYRLLASFCDIGGNKFENWIDFCYETHRKPYQALVVWKVRDALGIRCIIDQFTAPEYILRPSPEVGFRIQFPDIQTLFKSVIVVCGRPEDGIVHDLDKLFDSVMRAPFGGHEHLHPKTLFRVSDNMSAFEMESKVLVKTLDEFQTDGVTVMFQCRHWSEVPQIIRDRTVLVIVFKPSHIQYQKEYKSLLSFCGITPSMSDDWFDFCYESHSQPYKAITIWKFEDAFEKRCLFNTYTSVPLMRIED